MSSYAYLCLLYVYVYYACMFTENLNQVSMEVFLCCGMHVLLIQMKI